MTLKSLGIVAAVLCGLAAFSIAVARAMLPASACAVSEAQIDALKLEITYDAAKARLGCEGERELVFDAGGLRMETFRWRGTAWPYGTFAGDFYNGVMHGTAKVWLNVEVSWPQAGGDSAAAAR